MHGRGRFILHYVVARSWPFAGLFVLVAGAAAAAIGVQVAIKILVGAMAVPGGMSTVRTAVGLFVSLIAVESALWRLTGWLGCRTTVGIDLVIPPGQKVGIVGP